MAQLFPPHANSILRVALVVVGAFSVFVPLIVWAFARTPAATGQYRTFSQPVPFSHALHANGLRLDCRYCHAGAERAAMAGLPPSDACVSCHQDSLLETNLFAPVVESVKSGRPIRWRRVTTIPDSVFFNHAVHVRTGVGCEICHGPVDRMPQVYQTAPLTMEWCLACHRAPERNLRMADAKVAGWRRSDPQRGAAVAAEYDVRRLTSCSTCHR